MNFTTSKTTILKHLQTLSKVVPLRSTLPILSCVYLDSDENGCLFLKSSDLEQTVIINTAIKTNESSPIALPLAKLLEIVSALSDKEEIVFTAKENEEFEISSGVGNYKIAGKNPEEYPETPTTQTQEEITLLGKDLLDIVNKTTYATSKDDLKPALSGVYLKFENEALTAVGTDGHRLVKYTKKITDTKTSGAIVVPVKFLNIVKNEISNQDNVVFNVGENHIYTKSNKTTILSRIIKESFPDFNSVIPKEIEKTAATINAQSFINSLKRILIFSNKTTKQVVVNFNKNEIVLCAEDKETKSSAKERLKCEYNGEEVESGYNAQYLKEVVQHLGSHEVNIFLSSSLTAAVLKPNNTTKEEEQDLVALLMPLRTNT